jgi:hypothetical protein
MRDISTVNLGHESVSLQFVRDADEPAGEDSYELSSMHSMLAVSWLKRYLYSFA